MHGRWGIIDMKPNEKCEGVLSGNEKVPCFMVLKDGNKKDIMICAATTESKRSHILKYETHLTTPNLYCRFKDELLATCDGKGRVIIQYGNTSQNEFAAEAKRLKERNRKRREKEIENELLQMALHVESKHEKMVEDVKVLKIGAPKASEDVKKVDEHNDVQLSMDNFKFQRTIARGFFGEVNEYTSIKSGHSFAIKELIRSHALNQIFMNDREIKNHRIIRHKHIVQFYGSFQDEFKIYIVLERLSQTLRQVMETNGSLDEVSSGVVMKAVCKGLQYLHRMSVIHRDLKPENILMSNERIKLGDFGLATTKTGETWCGTPGYIAPELFRKETHRTPADMFSLGIMAHEMTQSRLPFTDEYWRKNVIRANTLKYVPPATFSQPFSTVMISLLNKTPSKRMTADEVLRSDWLFDLEVNYESDQIEGIRSEHL